MKKYVSELFEEIQAAAVQEEKIKLLQTYPYGDALKPLLKMALDPDIKFLPVDVVPYKPDKQRRGLTESNIIHQKRIFNYFLESHQPRLSPEKLATILNTVMSALCVEEGDVFMAILKKDLTRWGIDWPLVQIYMGEKKNRGKAGRPKGSKNATA